jgi:hypothetical protein
MITDRGSMGGRSRSLTTEQQIYNTGLNLIKLSGTREIISPRYTWIIPDIYVGLQGAKNCAFEEDIREGKTILKFNI